MKRQKGILKIGLSLMIAFIMLSSAGMVMADGTPEAGELQKAQAKMDNFEAIKLPTDITSQQPCPVWIIDLVSIDPGINDNIQEGTYPISIRLWNEPGCGPATVKVFCDIYKKFEGQHVTMYETSFEDNFDIYNNWIQIDADCGEVGGHYDSWSWSDARAYCDDHSFKSTMYDIYKGNQDDFLQCTKSFDMSAQEAIEVTFMAWVEGDGQELAGYYWPYDYLDFEVGDQTGTWINPYVSQFFLWGSGYYALPGSYNFFDTTLPLYNGYYSNLDYTPIAEDMGGGWWKITYTQSVAGLAAMGLDVTDIMFRFSWHTDPEQQFEGAYVDCFEVISIESSETKVFQTHSQGHFEIPECESKYTFPLPWTAEGDDSKEICYDIKLWLEVIDPEHESMNDWPDTIDEYVCVSDWFDVEVVDGSLEIETSFGGETIVPGDGVMQFGDDAHIMATIHVDGTLPASNIPVTITAHKKSWETLFESDCESGMGWTLYGEAHITDTDSWSGSKSIGFFDEALSRYKNNEFGIAESAMSVDLSIATEVYMDFYTKYITEPGYDYGRACLVDNYHNFVLGMSPALSGYQPDWMGPMQPMSKYQSYDLIDAYNYFVAAYGFFHDANGNQVYDVGFGFYFSSDSSQNYYSSSIYESGVWVDDVSIRALVIGEEVWTDTIIIPGPIAPCETVEVQFEWEDVPYSNYLICVEAAAEGACGNLGDEPECASILVVTDLEMAHWKEMESHDYTGEGNGEWGISSSDTDNYLATNADGTLYQAYSNAIAQLCPGGDGCLDISSTFTLSPGFTCTELINESFDTWLPAGWTLHEYVGASWQQDTFPDNSAWHDDDSGDNDAWLIAGPIDITGWNDLELDWMQYDGYQSYYTLNEVYVSTVDPAGDPLANMAFAVENAPTGNAYFHPMNLDLDPFVGAGDTQLWVAFRYVGNWAHELNVDTVVVSDCVGGAPVMTPPDHLNMTFDAWWDLDAGYDYVYVEVANCPCDHITDWVVVDSFTWDSIMYGGDDDGWIEGYTVDLVFPGMGEEICVRFRFTSDGSWQFRGMKIDDLAIPDIGFGPDPMNNLNNWCLDIMHYGQFWEYNDVDVEWCTDFPAYDIVDGLIWTTEISDAYEAYLAYETWYDFGYYATGTVRISADGGANWFILDLFTDQNPDHPDWTTYFHDLTPWVGSEILIEFLAEGDGSAGEWCIRNLQITGKQDNDAPMTTLQLTGQLTDAGWYSSIVSCVITATDVGAGMGEIHYILDGTEKVVSGETATFQVSTNGEHNLEYWGVDKTGNVEAHHVVPTFRIDTGSPPTVAITEPTPGLYLFGNKLLSLSKIFIIGAFNIEATASDAESGVYKVQFLLDGDVIGEDTETPFGVYCAVKHTGAGTITVIAEDFSGNTAEDTLDITYYKFL